MRIVLPWPDPKLSPNARLHWRAKVGPKQAAKIKAGWLTVAAEGYHATKAALAAHDGPIPVEMRFYPPDRRHRDDDNMIGSMKAARDGVADALGVDDRRFRPHYFFEDAEKPGRVEVIVKQFECKNVHTNLADPCADDVNGLPLSNGEAA